MELKQNRAQMPHYRSVENLLTKKESVIKAEKHEDGYIVPHIASPENPWDYDFKYEYENGNKEKYWNLDEEENTIIRLLKYRTDDNGYDCDGSGKHGCDLTREIYRKLWDWQDGESKKLPYGKIGKEGWMAGPETMNSFFIAFKYASDVPGKGKIDTKLYQQVVILQEKLNKFLLEKKDEKIWKEYAKNYHTLGNFVLVPAGFNTFRANQCNDFWDLSLFYLKQEVNNLWLQRDGIFTKYINYFFLWDYVCRNGSEYQVKSLVDGSLVEENMSRNLQPMETTLFLENVLRVIRRRGIFMTAMLRIEKAIGKEKYAELREKVFLTSETYSGYGGVIKEIKDEIKKGIEEAKFKDNKEKDIEQALTELAELEK